MIKQKRNREIRRRIIWPHIEKQTCHDARETEGTGQSGDNINRGQRHSLPNDWSEHITSLRTKCHADADFLRALRDHLRVKGFASRGSNQDAPTFHNEPRERTLLRGHFSQ